ncbi:response regulator [Marivirga sp. S37H4]|uniref:Response regulator n=1 Tax=Marivirga aurantiaca TaxID=2802615 RepID=A0A934WVQ4_9BACT|nr:response regulator [Marivirga aurantiaca]MBK6263812.1 response regulator [Marivirga aurantiaca]
MKKKLNCVLLVDDDEATNFLNSIFIEESEIAERTESVLNGREALDYLTCEGEYKNRGNNHPKPDLILLDINMPVMDGWDFIQAYKNLDDDMKGNIIIAMLTTSLNPDDKLKAEKIREISAFEHKPLSVEMLYELMEKYFSHHF